MDYFQQLKGIFIEPFSTLKKLNKEKGLKNPFRFFIISSLIAGIISIIFEMAKGNPLIEEMSPLAAAVLNVAMIIIFNIASIFALAGFCHLMVLAFGGKKPFYETFKPYAYITGFWIVTAFIAGLSNYSQPLVFLSFAVSIWAVILLVKGLKLYTGLSNSRLAGVCIITGVVFLIVLFLILKAVLPMLPAM